jgi:predicted dienelactone hydrolase
LLGLTLFALAMVAAEAHADNPTDSPTKRETTPASDVAASPPWSAGLRTERWIDESRAKRELIVDLWYPAAAELRVTTARRDLYFFPRIRALRDAPPAPGRFPLILFSHGLTAYRGQSAFLCEHLAERGYIVAACDHQGNTGHDFDPRKFFETGIDRPTDLRVMLDRLTGLGPGPKDFPLERVDRNRVAAMGHSLGGYTALAVGGAWVSVKGLPLPKSLTNSSDFYCCGDDRIKAVVALAPVCRPAFSPEGLAKLRVPTLLMAGDRDLVTPSADHQRPIFRNLGGPRLLITLKGASHFAFADEELVREAPFMVRALHQPTINRIDNDRLVCDAVLRFLDDRFEPRRPSRPVPAIYVQRTEIESVDLPLSGFGRPAAVPAGSTSAPRNSTSAPIRLEGPVSGKP